jgi:hypothetical protein
MPRGCNVDGHGPILLDRVAHQCRATKPMTIRARTNEKWYSRLQAESLLMLIFMVAHELFWAFNTSNWANPLIYLVIAVEIVSGGIVVAVGIARLSDKRWLLHVFRLALSIPWLMAILYVLYGLKELAAIPYGLYLVRDSLGRMITLWRFWRLIIGGLITGAFWFGIGNTLRKDINVLMSTRPEIARQPFVKRVAPTLC